MKKIKDYSDYLRMQRRSARRSAKQRAIKQARKSTFVPRRIERRELEEITLKVPKIFSLIDNPNETLMFFERLAVARRGKDRIHLDLQDVEKLTIDALLLLLSKLGKKNSAGERCRTIGGNEPKDEKVRTVFVQSGFYSHVTNRPVGYNSEKNLGIVTKHAGKRVREDVAAQIIHYATKKLFGTERKNGGLYRSLIECMANTRDHANIGAAKSQSWWVSVYFDEEHRVAYFAFLDNGVGIFKSVRMRSTLQQIGKFLGILSYPDILMDVLDAKLGSRTGLPYRGKGLPSVKRALDRSQIRNLKMVTNTAHLDATTRTGKVLDHAFRGTCLTWELHAN